MELSQDPPFHLEDAQPLSPRSQAVLPLVVGPWKSLPSWNPSFMLHAGPRQEFSGLVDMGSMEHSVMVTDQPRHRPGEPREPLPDAHSGSPSHGSCHCHPMGVNGLHGGQRPEPGSQGSQVWTWGSPPAPRAAGLALTLDLIVRRQKADVGERDPPRVPVIELHSDQVPIILEAEQACWQRGRVRETNGPRSWRGTRRAETSR